jgi:signal transduction histidine kinase
MHDELRGFFFQAIRELLVNVVKHARATAVRITLGEGDGLVWVGVRDDGVGLDGARRAATAAGRDGGFGLFSIRERIGSYGGRLTVESAPGSGTSFRMEVPTGDFSDRLGATSKSLAQVEPCSSGY